MELPVLTCVLTQRRCRNSHTRPDITPSLKLQVVDGRQTERISVSSAVDLSNIAHHQQHTPALPDSSAASKEANDQQHGAHSDEQHAQPPAPLRGASFRTPSLWRIGRPTLGSTHQSCTALNDSWLVMSYISRNPMAPR
ncbi:hypothetical protein EYF80_006180 [Liparis tanakae]|uniref:Uncharacterized protein n=1 Tax=Liparis tanakae TaxID=230148 RepID=A0A4Z2J2F2_9TELE|nr:hypothetical protein EYF80_006180 [Liparis tanakae]